jgi:predicted Zn-dependent peptidase
MKNAVAILSALLFALSATAQKETPLPKDLPPYGSQPAFQPPAVKAAKLPNGLTVWLVSQPGLPKVAFRLVELGGLASDPANRPGLSELLAATLNQGTKSRNARQIAEEIQSAGGDLEIDANRDDISVSTSVLSTKTAPTATLLADIAENATFPEDEVTLARTNLGSSLEQREAEPRFQADRALARALFGTGPYSIVAPTQDSIKQMTAGELRQEFALRFRPDQAILVAVGDFNADTMNTLIAEKFSGWKAPATPPVAVNATPSAPVAQTITLIPRPNSVQTTLVLGGLGPLRKDSYYEAATVANAIYGSTFTSRLVTNIREDKGYTYSPGSRLNTLRQADVLLTRADVRNAVTGASLNEIIYELNRMVTTSPTDEELSRAKRYLLGIEAVLLQLRSATADEVANLWLYGLGPDGIGTYNQKISATTAKDVDTAARKYFPAPRMSIVAVGDEQVIREALTPFGITLQEAK